MSSAAAPAVGSGTRPIGRRPTVVGLAIVALLGAGCSRSSTVGADEAIEILVIDGLDRTEAECLVEAVQDDLDLAEVTGVSSGLDTDELAVLFEASRSCRPAPAGTTGPVDDPVDALNDLDELEDLDPLDVGDVAGELLRGGVDPDLAVCVATLLLRSDDEVDSVSDETRKIDAIVVCEAAG